MLNATPAPGFAALIDSFTLYLEGMGRSPRTVTGYRSGATMFAAWCAAHDGPAAPADVTPPHLSGFFRDLLADGAASSANTRYWQLRAFFRWLLEEEEIRRSPLPRVPAPVVPEDWPSVPHADEIRRLLATCRGRTFVDLRDRALILFAVDSGARVGEMASMRLRDLDLHARTAIVLAKGGHTRPASVAVGRAELPRPAFGRGSGRMRPGHRAPCRPGHKLWEMGDPTITTYFGLVGEVLGRIEECLSGGASSVQATSVELRVAMGLRIGIVSRAAAIGVLADTPPAQAGMRDCMRSMCEAVAHLTWMMEAPDAVSERAACIELGQAKASVENRRRLITVARRQPSVDQNMIETMAANLRDAEAALLRTRGRHGSRFRHCNGAGRDQRHAAAWLRARATRRDAPTEDINIYAHWVACSADAHQLVPQRHSQPHGNFLELPESEVRPLIGWTVNVLLYCAPYLAAAIRPEAADCVREVTAWWRAQAPEAPEPA